MRKVIVVSFFKSNNLGDLALSNAIENLVIEKGYDVVKYDFPTVTIVNNNMRETSFNQKSITNSNIRKKLALIKKKLMNLIGVKILDEIYYFLNINFSEKWKGFKREIKSSDIIILAGGNMIMDISTELSIPNWATIFKTYCRLVTKYNKDLHIAYVGAGPINFQQNKILFSEALNLAKHITVRDQKSKEVCESLTNGKEIIETVDPVFSLPINIKDKRVSDISSLEKYKIGICVLGDHCFSSEVEHKIYIDCLFKLVNSLNMNLGMEKNKEYILFSTETADYISVRELYDKIYSEKLYNIKIKKINKVQEIIDLYENLNFLIGGRMHSLIFAQNCLLPFIGVIWQQKIIGFGEITNSSTRMYLLNELNNNINSISRKISEDIMNIELINQMYEKNKDLEDLVREGLFI